MRAWPRKIRWPLVLCVALGLSACQSTVTSRKKQRPAAYQALPLGERVLVDAGRIGPGMDTNAVYLAWGPPSEILAEPGDDATVTWLYYGTGTRDVRNWHWNPDTYWGSYDIRHNRVPLRYLEAEVTFHDGRVSGWHTYPVPRE